MFQQQHSNMFSSKEVKSMVNNLNREELKSLIELVKEKLENLYNPELFIID